LSIICEEDIIAWEDETGNKYCAGCGGSRDSRPMAKDDFGERESVTCDICGKKIL
jgi:hypothetical protein